MTDVKRATFLNISAFFFSSAKNIISNTECIYILTSSQVTRTSAMPRPSTTSSDVKDVLTFLIT